MKIPARTRQASFDSMQWRQSIGSPPEFVRIGGAAKGSSHGVQIKIAYNEYAPLRNKAIDF